jgi:16S rRNA G527 N7-methylase RsmG
MTPLSERASLAGGAHELGIELTARGLDALIGLVDELEIANAQFNLTAIRDRPGMLSSTCSTA